MSFRLQSLCSFGAYFARKLLKASAFQLSPKNRTRSVTLAPCSIKIAAKGIGSVKQFIKALTSGVLPKRSHASRLAPAAMSRCQPTVHR